MRILYSLLTMVWLLLTVTILIYPVQIQNLNVAIASQEDEGPVINDPNFKAELVYKGIRYGTNMAVLAPNDFLVLERYNGTVQRIVNGIELEEPVLDVNVAAQDGMLGIAVSQSDTGSTYVFLYFTEVELRDGEDVEEGKDPLGNRLYRYELVNNKLINPVLLLDLPATPGIMHHGGEIFIGPDNNIYLVIGEVGATRKIDSKAINVKNGLEPDGRAGILRVTQDGQPVGKGILGDETPLNLYYAYGIRNSFGMDFDPVTGNLWDTENGPEYGDEINLVEPGFNSGYKEIQGMIEDKEDISLLEDFGGKGKYSDPEFVWKKNVGPTALIFVDTDKYGTEYQNDIFVGDVNNGYIHHFYLNQNRTELVLDDPLNDEVPESSDEESDEEIQEEMIFGQGFGIITDMQVGPDGYLYVLTHDESEGAIYKIVPA
jgi:aldose sugar dehydrogenase